MRLRVLLMLLLHTRAGRSYLTGEAAVVLSRRHESRRGLAADSRAGAATAHASSDGDGDGLRVAVVGGGMAGLAVTRALYRHGSEEGRLRSVTIFDPAAPGTSLGATAVAAGLLHPLSPRGKLMWGGAEGLAATLALVEEAQEHLDSANGHNASSSSSSSSSNSSSSSRSAAGTRILSAARVVRPALPGPNQKRFTPGDDATELSLDKDNNGEQDMRWVPLEELGGLLGQEVPRDLAESLGRGKGGGGGASLIEKGFVVDTVAYSKGLWMACAAEGAQWRQRRVARLQDLEGRPPQEEGRGDGDGDGGEGRGFDVVVATAGAGMRHIAELRESLCGAPLSPPPTTTTKGGTGNNAPLVTFSRGQSLEYAGGDGASSTISPPPASALLCGDYVVPVRGRLIVGATHEPLDLHSEEGEESADSEASEEPDLVFAAEKLEPAAHLLWPPLRAVKPTAATAAVRVNPRRTHLGKLPLAGRIVVGASAGAAHSAATAPTASGDHGSGGGGGGGGGGDNGGGAVSTSHWVLTALGSRGLIHHAFLADRLAQAILTGDDTAIPAAVRVPAVGDGE